MMEVAASMATVSVVTISSSLSCSSTSMVVGAGPLKIAVVVSEDSASTVVASVSITFKSSESVF